MEVPTKTLDEVIRAVSVCNSMTTDICNDCPYWTEGECFHMENDILYYLLEYQKVLADRE